MKYSSSEIMDVEAALELVGGDEELLKEVIELFLKQDYPEQHKLLKDGIDKHDAQVVKAAAHSVKGAVLSFGSQALANTALQLEIMGRNDNLMGAEDLLQELNQEVKQFTDIFAQYI